MRINRFFVPPQLLFGRIARLNDPDLVKQIGKVLRLAPGEEIVLLDGDGFEYIAKILKVLKNEVQVEIMKRQANTNEPDLKITLYQALIKKDNFEWVLQKCAEIGVSAFVPILSERSEKKGLNMARAGKVLKEAAEQSGRGIIPSLADPIEYPLALSRAAAGETPNIILHPDGEAIGSYSKSGKLLALNIFIGPEGGFSQEELDLGREFMKKGRPIDIVSLGKLVLRSETAGVVAAGIMLNK
jgi:16S rRNA (uracil1498-N3)-methyltransferase